MPEIRFRFCWPDGTVETAYSPSLVVKDYFEPGEYALDEFLERARAALQIGSSRVEARYGRPCSLALSQISQLESTAARYRDFPEPKVQFLRFLE